MRCGDYEIKPNVLEILEKGVVNYSENLGQEPNPSDWTYMKLLGIWAKDLRVVGYDARDVHGNP